METNAIETAPASMPARRRRRDQRVKRFIRRVRTLAPHVENPVFAPMLAAFARVSLLLERGYEFLRDKDVVGVDGELRPSVDVIRRLAETQAHLGRELGLTPTSMREFSREKRIDLAAEAASYVEVRDGD